MITAIRPDNGSVSQNIMEINASAKEEYVFHHYGVKRHYDSLPGWVKEIITPQEFDETVTRVYDILEKESDIPETRGYGSFSYEAIATNIKHWAMSKGDFIKTIKASPLYDPAQPWKIVKPIDLERAVDTNEIDSFANWIINQTENESEFGERGLARIISFITHTPMTEEDIKFIQEKQSGYPKKYTGLMEAKPVAGQKTSKYIRKVMTMKGFFDKEKKTPEQIREAEQWFARYADAINPIIFKRTGVLSIDPVDFLLMSNGNSWASCYWINKYRPGSYEGCYSAGTWSYMCDDYTWLLYTPSENDSATDIAERKKILRQCVFFNRKDTIVHSRLYPQSNDNENGNILRKDFRAYAQTILSELFGLPNYWNAKSYSNNSNPFVDKSDNFMGCYDPEYFTTWASTNKANYESVEYPEAMEIGASAVCPICGEDLLYDAGRYICSDCDQEVHECECCGCTLYDDDGYCLDDGWYCGDCTTYDDYLDERLVTDNEEWYTYHNRYGYEYTISETGLNRAMENGDIIECADCGEYFYYNCNGRETADGEWVCEDCFGRDYFECEECGEVYKRNNVDDENYEFVSSLTGECRCLCDDCGNRIREEEQEILKAQEQEASETDSKVAD